MKPYRRPAFTLVEILVVIGIVTLLVAILMPVVGRAREQARMVMCVSNLRQLSQAFTLYANTNDRRSLRYDPTYQNFWMNQMRVDYAAIDSVRLCPNATELSYGWGTALKAWGPDTNPASNFFRGDYGSYGFNSWMHHEATASGYHRMTASNPELIPVFADASWVDGWPRETDPLPADLYMGAQSGQTNMGRFLTWRHGHRTNLVFLDGHAGTMELGELYTLKWNSNSKSVPMVVPGPPN